MCVQTLQKLKEGSGTWKVHIPSDTKREKKQISRYVTEISVEGEERAMMRAGRRNKRRER